jgi:peptidoglycan/LPS O-acetylase OafA/YrhL
MENKTAHIKYRPDIDGIRAIAIILTLFFHAKIPYFSGGFIGVDVFFVISGFLITSIILKNLNSNSFSFKEFYIRRVKRIFPVLIVVLISVWLIGWNYFLLDEFKLLNKHLAAGTVFSSNLVLFLESGNYFAASSESKLLLHLWSLAIEEQFYLIWPLSLFIIWKFQKHVLKIIFAIIIISFILNIYTINFNKVMAFYFPVTRFWELLFGGVLAYLNLFKKNSIDIFINKILNKFNISIKSSNLKSILGISLIILGLIFCSSSEILYPGFWALFPVIGSFLLIFSDQNSFINKYFLSNRIMVFIGGLSYSLYLWHWPILAFSNTINGGESSLITNIFCLFVSLILSYLSYILIEKPIRFSERKLTLNILIFTPIIIGIITSLLYFYKVKPLSSHDPLITKINDSLIDWTAPNAHIYEIYEKSNPKNHNNGKVLYWGDSNMGQYWSRIEKIQNEHPENSKSILFAYQTGCFPVLHVSKINEVDCLKWNEKIYKLRNDAEIDTVVLAANWHALYEAKGVVFNDINNQEEQIFYNSVAMNKFFNQLSSQVKAFKENRKKVYLILNIPVGKEYSPKSLLTRSFINGIKINEKKFVDNPKFMSENLLISSKLKKIADENGAIIIDPTKLLCHNSSCQVMTNEFYPIYLDSTHLNASYVRENASFIDETLLIHEKSVENSKIN